MNSSTHTVRGGGRGRCARRLLGVAAAGLLLCAGGPTAVQAQVIPAPGTNIFIEVHNVQVSNAAHTISWDVYISGSALYVANALINANNGLQNIDIVWDVDLGTDGSTGAITATSTETASLNQGSANYINSTTAANGPVLGSNPYPPTGYELSVKTQLVRTPANDPLTVLPTKVSTVTVTIPASANVGTITAGNANIQMRTVNNGFGTKWSDFLAHTNQLVGSSAGATQPLPVSLADFSARKSGDGARVQLDWSTVSETGTAYFEVERSAAEGGVYGPIGVKVGGAGTSSSRLDYRSYDGMPLVGMNWYRLKVVDLGGQVSYSGVRSVRFDGGVPVVGETVSLYPNPVRSSVGGGAGHLQVFSTSDQRVSYTISDGVGRLVGGGSVEVSKGGGSYAIEGLEGLPAGTYYLSAKGATLKANLKFNKTE